MPVIPALGRLKWEDHQFEASYRVRPCQNVRRKKKEKEKKGRRRKKKKKEKKKEEKEEERRRKKEEERNECPFLAPQKLSDKKRKTKKTKKTVILKAILNKLQHTEILKF
jgi:hypothetical protein